MRGSGTLHGRVAARALVKARSGADKVGAQVVERRVLPYKVAHEEITERVELLAGEGLGEEVGRIEVRADVKNPEQAVLHIVVSCETAANRRN